MKQAKVLLWLALVGSTICESSAQERSDNPVGRVNIPAPRQELNKLKNEIVPALPDRIIKKQVALFVNAPVSQLKLEIKSLSTELKQKIDLFHGPIFRFKDARFELNGMTNQGGKDSLSLLPYSQNVLDYNLGVTSMISHLPFNVGIKGNANNIYATSNNPLDNFYKFNFDHRKYIQDVQNGLMKKLSPDVIAATVLQKINSIKAQYDNQLKNEVNEIRNDFLKQYNIPLQIPTELLDISITDLSSLQNKLLNGSIIPSRDSLLNITQANANRSQALEKVFEKIVKIKSAFDNNAAVKQLRSIIPVTPATYKAFISNPANLEKILDDHVNLSTFQRLFFNITKLDIGQNAIKSGEFSLEDVVHSGINAEFQNRKSTVGLVYGKSNRIDNWMQTGLQSMVANEYSKIAGFKFGTGTSASFEQSVSINFFDFNSPLPVNARDINQQSEYLPVARHKDATITYHSAFSIRKANRLSVDISKSFGGFTQGFSADSLSYKTNPYSSLIGDAGKANYAARIDYAGDIWNSEIGAYFKKVGLGYNNPGNAYLNRGETSLGLRFGKKLLKNKLSLRYAGDFRNQIFDPAKNYFHHSINNKLQAGLKLPKSSRITLSYSQNNSRTRFIGEDSKDGINSRIQVDGSYNFRLGHRKIINYATLSHQQLKLPMIGGSDFSNSMLLFVYSSSVVIKKNVLTLSLLMNKSNSKEYYFSTSTSSIETNYGFRLLEGKLRLNSALGYYANSGWNKQIGIKQQLGADLLKKFNVDVEVGYKKAVQVIHQELANQFFATIMTHYNF